MNTKCTSEDDEIMAEGRTSYVYEFTYNSAPGLREVFQCKYVTPDEALKRFQRIISLAKAPFDFKIRVLNEASGEESTFQIKGTISEMFEKFKVFLETSTGYEMTESIEENEILEMGPDEITIDTMSNFEKLQIIIYASFKHGKFSSLDVVEIYEATFVETLPKSTASTYLARMWNNGKGHLERFGNRTGYTYRLKTELPEVQKQIKKAEEIIATIQIQMKK